MEQSTVTVTCDRHCVTVGEKQRVAAYTNKLQRYASA
jgi:hypothetical protein